MAVHKLNRFFFPPRACLCVLFSYTGEEKQVLLIELIFLARELFGPDVFVIL